MAGDDYVKVEGELLAVTKKAVYLDIGTGEFWVPRSLLIGGDDISLRDGDIEVGDTRTWQIREWFAEKEGML